MKNIPLINGRQIVGEESVNNGPELICRRVTNGVVLAFKEQRIYDIIAVENVEAQIRAILDEKPSNMVINFSGVDFMVTRVINMLLVALKNVRTRGGEVYLTGMNDNIRRVFHLMRLDLIFKIFDREDQTLAALGNTR